LKNPDPAEEFFCPIPDEKSAIWPVFAIVPERVEFAPPNKELQNPDAITRLRENLSRKDIRYRIRRKPSRRKRKESA
jgi:hypothetical protein